MPLIATTEADSPHPNRQRQGSLRLAELNAYLAQSSRAAGQEALGSEGPWPDLRSARRFRETWERLGAEVRVQQARDRAPVNAGPLNPQRLIVETLARMGELSPHYLRRFLEHAETLLWLEQILGGPPSATSHHPRKARRKP